MFSQDHLSANGVLAGDRIRSDSPEFGFSGHMKTSDPMLIDDKMHNVSPDLQPKGHDGKKTRKDSEETVAELKEKLRVTTNSLREQQEEHK